MGRGLVAATGLLTAVGGVVGASYGAIAGDPTYVVGGLGILLYGLLVARFVPPAAPY